MFPVTDPILVFTILALGMLAAPVLAEKIRIPDLVLLLGFGAVLGPNGLHVLERNSSITMLGAIGLLYIMFQAGLEIDLYRFSRSCKRSITFGLLTFLVPQTIGTLAGRYVLGMTWPASLLLASMFASHTLLAYPLASRLGIARREPVAVAVGATIITDTLALLVLAVIADSARGIELTAGFWAVIVLGMAALTVLTWRGIPVAARWFFQRVTEKSNAQFLFVIVTVCGCAWLSHFARMEPIIGAFLAGAAFNRLIPENSPLMNRVTFAGSTLFIPFFLISVGMLVDFRAMVAGPRSWLVGATMVTMVVLTKYIAAQAARRMFGYSRDAGQVMFGLSVVQAAATLAAVIVGYNLNIFDETVLNGAIAMILVTCPLGSWAVDHFGRRMATEVPVRPASADTEQRILVPVAHPETATRLLDLAFLLRNTIRPGGIYPLAVARDGENPDSAVEQGEKLLGYCLAHAASADIPVTPGLRVAGNISDGIIHAARELRSGLLVIGWTGEQSAGIRIFGTVMQHLVENCASRLLFCRLVRPLNTTRRLIAVFPPAASHRRDFAAMIRDAKLLAQRIGAELRIYTVASETGVLVPTIENTKPACRMTSAQAATWNRLRQAVFEELRPDDMILLPADRRTGLFWTPALDHLPEWIAERFPDMNLLVDYPSLPAQEQGMQDPSASPDEFPSLLPVDLHQGCSLEQALKNMAETAFPDAPETARAAWHHLADSARSYPVELAPGAVLLHARSGELEKPLLMVCHTPDGWAMPGFPVAPRIILVLLGSQSSPPERHLKTLSQVAGRMHEAGHLGELQSAGSAAEICAMLSGKNG